MTGYVSTRYYRAPEIMLTWQKYDVAVDVWSAGCIFSEMLEGKPLFPGKDHVNQFSIITELLGTPPDEVIQTICSENTLRFVQSLPKRERVDFRERFPNTDPEALDLLDKMLVFDLNKRITAAQSLSHPYLAPYHNPADEPEAEEPFDWSFNDADLPIDTWKVMMYSEILGMCAIHLCVRLPQPGGARPRYGRRADGQVDPGSGRAVRQVPSYNRPARTDTAAAGLRPRRLRVRNRAASPMRHRTTHQTGLCVSLHAARSRRPPRPSCALGA